MDMRGLNVNKKKKNSKIKKKRMDHAYVIFSMIHSPFLKSVNAKYIEMITCWSLPHKKEWLRY